MDSFRQLRQEGLLAVIDDGVRRIEAQAVDVVFVNPVQSVLDEEAAHVSVLFAVEVECWPQAVWRSWK